MNKKKISLMLATCIMISGVVNVSVKAAELNIDKTLQYINEDDLISNKEAEDIEAEDATAKLGFRYQLNIDDFKLANKGYYIGYLYDSNNNSHKIGYLGIDENANIGFLVDYVAMSEPDKYYTAELYKDINGLLEYSEAKTFNSRARLSIGKISSSFNLSKSKYRNDKYIYIRFGVSNSADSNYSDSMLFKVENPFYGYNEKPIIYANNLILGIGQEFNPLANVSANDNEDGDLTDRIEVIENNVDITKKGIYKVVYQVTDSNGVTVNKEISVSVKKTLSSFLDSVYKKALGRTSDVDGKNYWLNLLSSGTEGGRYLLANLLNEPEFINKNMTSKEYIVAMYDIIVDREPEEEGFNYWYNKYETLKAIMSEKEARFEILNWMMNEAEFQGVCSEIGIKF